MNVLPGDDRTQLPFSIDFIDPLFAAALSIGLTNGIMQEAWFSQWETPIGDDWFRLWTFFLGFMTLVLSWIGYHQSIRLHPLRGFLRFFLDVSLVLLYALMMIQYKEFGAVIAMLVVSYLLFILWDLAKLGEYGEELRSEREDRSWGDFYHPQIVTGVWTGLSLVLGLLYSRGLVSPGWALFGAYIVVVVYRLHKRHFLWRTIGPGVKEGALGRRKSRE